MDDSRSSGFGVPLAVLAAALFAAGALAAQPIIDDGCAWSGALAIRSTIAAAATLLAAVWFGRRLASTAEPYERPSLLSNWPYVLAFAAANGGLYAAIAASGAPLAVALQNLAPVLLVVWFAVVVGRRQSLPLICAAVATTLGVVGLLEPWKGEIAIGGIVGGIVCAAGVAGLTLLGESKSKGIASACRMTSFALAATSVIWWATYLTSGSQTCGGNTSEILSLAAIGLLGTAIPFVLLAEASRRAGAMTGAVGVATEPLFAWFVGAIVGTATVGIAAVVSVLVASVGAGFAAALSRER